MPSALRSAPGFAQLLRALPVPRLANVKVVDHTSTPPLFTDADPQRHHGSSSERRQSACYPGRAIEDGETLHGDAFEVRVRPYPFEDVRLHVVLHRLAVLPDVNAAIGVGRCVCQPGLGDQAGQVGENGSYGLAETPVVLLANALQVEVNDLDVHLACTPFGAISTSPISMLGLLV